MIYVTQYARGERGKWFRFGGSPVRFKDLDAAIGWAAAAVKFVHGHRFDLRHKGRVVATVYRDHVTRFDGGAS